MIQKFEKTSHAPRVFFLQGAVVAGFEGVAVGAKASVEISSQGANLKAVDAGLQYSHGKSITASVFS